MKISNQLLAIIYFITIYSCGNERTNANVQIRESDSVDSFLLWMKPKYQVRSVTWRLETRQNDAGRIDVPGPNDWYLSARVEFDSGSVDLIRKQLVNRSDLEVQPVYLDNKFMRSKVGKGIDSLFELNNGYYCLKPPAYNLSETILGSDTARKGWFTIIDDKSVLIALHTD